MVMKRINPETTGAADTSTDNGAPAWAEGEEPEGTQTAPTQTAVVTAPTTKAPALQAKGGVVARSAAEIDVIRGLKDAYPVAFNTLTTVMAAQGRFSLKETGQPLGTDITLELMSYQDNYVVSPNDDSAPKEHVRYSDDGITCSDGTPCLTHLADLKELGYTKAKINARNVVVGALLSAQGTKEFDGTLVQIDLSPMSKAQFLRYQIQTAYDISKGKKDPDAAKISKLSADVATNNDKKQYTLVKFGYGTQPAA